MALTKIKADGLTADLIDETKLADNSIDSEHYNDGSIDNAHLADDAVGVAELSATGTASSSTFLRGDNSWAAVTSTTINNNADNRVITGSGTANTLEAESSITYDGTKILNISSSAGGFFQGTDTDGGVGLVEMGNGNVALQADTGNAIANSKIQFLVDNSEKMTLKDSGKLGIGNTDPSAAIEVTYDSGGSAPSSGTAPEGIAISYGTSDDKNGGIWFSPGFGDDQGISGISSSRISGYETDLRFYTNNTGSARAFTERMRIKPNGYVGIGNADPQRELEILNWSSTGSSAGLELGDVGIRSSKTGTSTISHLRFYNGNGQVGNIQTASSSTTFNSTSDYRLKENVVSISDGITRVKQLKPSKFNWISDKTNTPVDGFLAHEVSSIVPESISGTKDAVAVQKDVDDAIADKVGDPIYQSIDQSKLVPLLTAALKEAIAKIETLETKVAALEAK